jgi:hypothetical protein
MDIGNFNVHESRRVAIKFLVDPKGQYAERVLAKHGLRHGCSNASAMSPRRTASSGRPRHIEIARYRCASRCTGVTVRILRSCRDLLIMSMI